MEEPFLSSTTDVTFLHYLTVVELYAARKLLKEKNNHDLQLNLYKTVSADSSFFFHFRAA